MHTVKKTWTVAILAALVLSAIAVPGSDGDDRYRTAYGYDGSVYTFLYHLDGSEYYSEMTSFQAGTDTVLRVPYDLEGYPLKKIGDAALSGASGITEIVIPAYVASLGSKVFEKCGSLKTVIFLGSMPTMASDTFEGTGASVMYLERFASSWSGFSQTSKSVMPVYTYAAAGCSFEYYELDGSVTVLRHLSGTAIRIPSELDVGSSKMKVKFIGDMAFYYDYYNKECTQDRIESVEIADGIEIIRTAAFKYCTYMETLSLPASVRIIDDEAFRMPIDTVNYSTGSLKEIKLPDGLQYMGFECFRMSNQLRSVTIPDTVTHYGEGAFRASARLESVTLGKGMTELPQNSFDNCYMLKSVTIPDTIESIGSQCFNKDYSLESIVIPSSVTSIGPGAFSDCGSFSHITMPDGVTIGDGCFRSSNLMTVSITSASTGHESVISEYFNRGGWALPGMDGSSVSLLILDTADHIEADITGISGYIRFTEKTVNSVGGSYTDGTETLIGADRAGKTFEMENDEWTMTEVGTVTAVCDDRYGTLDTHGGTFPKGATITINAKPKALCVFSGWSDGDTSPHRTMVVNGDIHIYAIFTYSPATLDLVVNPEGSGEVSGNGRYTAGTEVKISATPSEGYHFIGWSNGDANAVTTVVVEKDMSLEAKFGNVTITFDLNGGKMKIGPMYSNKGWSITLPGTIETLDGKSIIAWDIGGERYDVGAEYKVTGDTTAKAVWGSPSGTDNSLIVVAVIAAIAAIAVAFFVIRRKHIPDNIRRRNNNDR